MTVRVVPQGNQWVVRVFSTVVSNHRKKSRAKQRGRKEANKRGVPLFVHRADGTFQNRVGGGR